MVKLLLTDSYFDLFPILTEEMKKNANDLNKKNVIFCEAKVSLMTERFLCSALTGSFNTDVYSFGKYLRTKKRVDKLLSKEGSAMAIKQILSKVQLKCFKQSKQNLAPTLYDLIIQLKSAKITPSDVSLAAQNTHGVLKNKLNDIAAVYGDYEEYITKGGFEDQSSMLSYLPEVIYADEDIASADVFLLGYGGFTAQMRAAIDALINKANSVTAILTEGENKRLYVNETAEFIRQICGEKGVYLVEEKRDGSFAEEGKIIAENLFSPVTSARKTVTDKISVLEARNPDEEVLRVAEIIKKSVISGECRYRDITVAIGDLSYKDYIKSAFSSLDIPYFLDEQKIPDNHPLVTLITAYVDVFRKGLERGALTAFFKNPLFCRDKNLSDLFETYLIKYNINYGRIRTPFTFPAVGGADLCALEDFRARLVRLFDAFDVRAMLANLCVEEGLNALAVDLKKASNGEDAAVTEQIYGAVTGVLDEMDLMLYGVGLSLTEYKNIFISGVSAMKLSIIPQYNDAVFIGGFKETALAKAKRLFVVGLTSGVPTVHEDIALLSDTDITALEQIKVLVEPKIRVVNHRTRENVGMALCAFIDKLYLSFPAAAVDGKKNVKSEVLTTVEELFKTAEFPAYDGYTAFGQGVNSFAKACGEFAEGKREDDKHYDFSVAASFFHAADKAILQPLLDGANKEIKERLSGDNVSLIGGVTSPTAIEDYYKCPYRAFIAHGLKVKERDEGNVNVLSVGNLMHEILRKYVYKANAVKDKRSSDALFESIKEEVLERDEYKKFLSDAATSATVVRVLRECREYCYKTHLSLKKSAFDKCRAEVAFGDGDKAEYPAIPLLGGKVRLKGKIDRVDENDKYFRVLDYKTGKTDPSEKALFAGVKLQLYLYAAAVMEKYKNGGGKTPAGLYYLPVSDKYEKSDDKGGALAVGKTLAEKDALTAIDKDFFTNGQTDFTTVKVDEKSGKIRNGIDGAVLKAYIDYAVKAGDTAAERMVEGVIKPSPYENACEYCEYLSLCGQKDICARKLGTVDESTFTGAIKNGGND